MYDVLLEYCVTACAACPSAIGDDTPSWSSATVDVITAHVC